MREAAAADRAASSKTAKYTELSKTHHITPVAIETGGLWNDLAIEFINELGKMITSVTQEPRETQYLFQRMSVALLIISNYYVIFPFLSTYVTCNILQFHFLSQLFVILIIDCLLPARVNKD